MPKFKPGDAVTCLHELEAYGSDYGPNKGTKIVFKPGDQGVVISIAPKVRIVKVPGDPRFDGKDEFLVVDYQDSQGKVQRVGLDFCNAKALKVSELMEAFNYWFASVRSTYLP